MLWTGLVFYHQIVHFIPDFQVKIHFFFPFFYYFLVLFFSCFFPLSSYTAGHSIPQAFVMFCKTNISETTVTVTSCYYWTLFYISIQSTVSGKISHHAEPKSLLQPKNTSLKHVTHSSRTGQVESLTSQRLHEYKHCWLDKVYSGCNKESFRYNLFDKNLFNRVVNSSRTWLKEWRIISRNVFLVQAQTVLEVITFFEQFQCLSSYRNDLYQNKFVSKRLVSLDNDSLEVEINCKHQFCSQPSSQ